MTEEGGGSNVSISGGSTKDYGETERSNSKHRNERNEHVHMVFSECEGWWNEMFILVIGGMVKFQRLRQRITEEHA